MSVLDHVCIIVRWLSPALYGTSRLCGLGYIQGPFTEKKKASWRHNKVGLSPSWDDGPVGWQQSVANYQLGRELEYWLARAPKRLQPQNCSFYLLWQHHTVPPCESPFFYSLQWFIINCTERKPQCNTGSIMEKMVLFGKKQRRSNSCKESESNNCFSLLVKVIDCFFN